MDMEGVPCGVWVLFQNDLEVVCNVPGCSDTVGIGVLYLVKADIKHTIHKFVGPFDGYLPLDRAAEHSADVASHPLDAHIVEGLHVLLCLVKELLVGTAHVLHGVCFAGGNLACEHPVDLGPPVQQAAHPLDGLGGEGQNGILHVHVLGKLEQQLVYVLKLRHIGHMADGAHLQALKAGLDQPVSQIEFGLQGHIVFLILKPVPHGDVDNVNLFRQF